MMRSGAGACYGPGVKGNEPSNFFKILIDKSQTSIYNSFCCEALSPNGKATDSDSVISRFEPW